MVGLALVSACASKQPGEALGPNAVVQPVVGLKQERDKECGLTCLTALLRFHGQDLDAEARRRFPRERLEKEGIPAGELRDYLRGRAFRAFLVHGTLDESAPTSLLALLKRGLPTIVELATAKTRHYALATGFDPAKRLVVLMDPARGAQGGLPYARFEELWARADHLMLAVAPPAP